MAEHSFPNAKEVVATADSIWWGLAPEDWEEAFAALPPIGDRTDLAEATPEIMDQIRAASSAYRERFGFPFATSVIGKTAPQILLSLQERLERSESSALRANAEQALQVARNRLKRILPRQ